MKTLHSQHKKTVTNNNAGAIGGMIPLDLRAPVRGVRFGEIISFLIDNHNDTLAVTLASGTFDPAAHDAAWDHKFARRMASMTATERTLLTTAMIGHTQAPEFSLDDWINWDDPQRATAVTELVEKVTRLYVLHHLLATSGRSLAPYRQVVISMIQRTRFCTHG